MNFLVRPLDRATCLSYLLGAAAMLCASSSHADNCGSSERSSLPQCSRFVSLGTTGQVEVYNLCSQKISVKLDITGASDQLLDIPPGYGVQANVGQGTMGSGSQVQTVNKATTASCCPRMSACSFPAEAAIGDSAPDPWSRAQAAKNDSRFKGFR